MYNINVLNDRVDAVRDFLRVRLGDPTIMVGVEDPSELALDITFAIKDFDGGRTLRKLSGEVTEPLEHLLPEARLSLIPVITEIIDSLAKGSEWDELKESKVATLHELIGEINKGVLKIEDFGRFAGNIRSVGLGCRITT